MSDTLNKKEIKRLIELGKRIQLGLSCDINGQGIPCRTDRLQAVEDMREYLAIHDIRSYDVNNISRSVKLAIESLLTRYVIDHKQK